MGAADAGAGAGGRTEGRRPLGFLGKAMGAVSSLAVRLMPVGRRSLLFGVHQFLLHPLFVWRAWRDLYGPPTWREVVCIFIHDWGYWRCADMDGPDGVRHPELGARLAGWLLGPAWRDLVLLHSRHYARLAGRPPSRLCWADKLSVVHYPEWLYLLLARLSGEIREYRREAADAGFVPLGATDREWFRWLRSYLVRVAREADAAPVAPREMGRR